MYKNKIKINRLTDTIKVTPTEITNKGVEGIIESLEEEHDNSILKANELSGYAKKREMEIAEEHNREKEIFKKVLRKIK